MLALHRVARVSACAVFVAACSSNAAESSPSQEPEASEQALSAAASIGDIAEKDLAVVFAADDPAAPRASTVLPVPGADGAGSALLPKAAYDTVARAFAATSVGDALQGESRYGDWRLISFRVVPCSPLTPAPGPDADELCWPEVRLVLQPVVENVRVHERTATAFADDRAIHALYDVDTRMSGRERAFITRIREAARSWRGGPFRPLSASELSEFRSARDATARKLLASAFALRDTTVAPNRFRNHGVRPESDNTAAIAKAFSERVASFLGTYAAPKALHTLTAFSLPEGREPAHLDEWVFLSFSGKNGLGLGALTQDRITMRSVNDGRTLVDLGTSPRSSQSRDDEVVYEAQADASRAAEIAARVILGPGDVSRLTPVVRDPRVTSVPSTTCASCHKLNPLRFDFHNLGYLEDRDLTVSPRVVSDVAADLQWLAQLAKRP